MPAKKEHKETKTTKEHAAQASAPKSAPGVAGDGSSVKLHYTGTLSDGEVFDSSKGRDPIMFTIGTRQVIPGFEHAVIGMKVGEKKKVTLAPKDAYGDANPSLLQKVPLVAVQQAGITPEAGMIIGLAHPSRPGMEIPAKIVSVDAEHVTLDLNHPLAGKELTFDLELVSLE